MNFYQPTEYPVQKVAHWLQSVTCLLMCTTSKTVETLSDTGSRRGPRCLGAEAPQEGGMHGWVGGGREGGREGKGAWEGGWVSGWVDGLVGGREEVG